MIFTILKYLFISSIIYLVWTLVIKTYLNVQFYVRQGLQSNFKPLVGWVYDSQKSTNQGDFAIFLKNAANQIPKPRAIFGNLGNKVSIFLQDPSLFKEFFGHHDKYVKSSIFDIFKVISPNGLLFSEGKIWKKHRKIVSMAFHYNFLKEITPEIVKISDEFLTKLKKTSIKKLDIMNEFQAIMQR